MLTTNLPGLDASVRLYRFAGVEIDIAQFQLRVDGRPIACSRKAFELLVLLCHSPRTVLAREAVIDALWPGGQVISDEALTQIIFRARTAIDPYGELITTIRGIGLRLDASVDASSETPRASLRIVSESGTAPGRVSSRHNVRFAVLTLAALLVTVTVLFWPPKSTPEVLNAGYGLTADAIMSEQPGTGEMIIRALEADATGERARGIKLLEAVHRDDASTPIAALFLAHWEGGLGNGEAEMKWLEQARARIGDRRELYLNLMLDYFTAESADSPEEIIHAAGAVLDARPGAWRMRLARAHLMEFNRMREAALFEIQQIQVTKFGNRKLDQVIADRASFGDVAGAQAMLDAIPPESDPATHAFLSGRIAWSRGDFDAAFGHFSRTLDLSYSVARMDLYRRSLLYSGAIAAMQGRDDEAVDLLQNARGISEGYSLIDAVDVALFLAQLHNAVGRKRLSEAELETALDGSNVMKSDTMSLASAFVAFRLQPGRILVKPESIPAEYDALWLAMAAYAANDEKSARAALGEARARGIDFTRMADEARWLEWKLGEPVTAESVLDPPYPPLSRVVLRRELRKALAGN